MEGEIQIQVTHFMSQRAKNISTNMVRVTEKGNMHPIDLVAAVCKRDRKASGQKFDSLVSSGKFNETDFVWENNVKLLPFKTAMKILMLLEGPVANENRERIARLMQLHIAGDERLLQVFQQNADAGAVLNKAARESLLAEQAAADNTDSFNMHVHSQLMPPITGIDLVLSEIGNIRTKEDGNYLLLEGDTQLVR